MKRILQWFLLLNGLSFSAGAQNVFDPSDPIVRYSASQPLGSRQHPDPSIPGLQKWVSVPTIGVSIGSDTFDASSFKQYFINFKGQGMAFRLKFPKTYSTAGGAGKKYPVMLFLHGGGEVGCPTNGGIYNNERPVWLGGKFFRNKVDQGLFDGFLLYPQFVISNGCFSGWLNAPGADFDAIVAIIDSLTKYCRADIDRVVANGLSGGGYGCFRMAGGWPKTLAKIMPTSCWGPTNLKKNFVHIPIWFATGGLDPEPSPAEAQSCLNDMKSIGADIRYTIFPTLGHNCWYQHWQQPDYIPEMLAAHKANPLVFFQHDEFCNADSIDAKLGLTAGFYAYEWRKDGVTIATTDPGNPNQVLDPSSVKSYTGNEITVKAFGTYQARFRRTATSDWSEWSPKPAVIRSKSTTQTAAIQVQGDHSKVLVALDGSTTVPLTLPEGFLHYEWFRTSDNERVDTNQTFLAPVGTYKARYSEQFGCSTLFSPEFTVVDAAGSPKPAPAQTLVATPVSGNVVRLQWTQSAGASDPQAGFEVYRATTAGGPYSFVRLVPASTTTFRDSNLVTNTVYYYRVRAVNGTGAADASNEAASRTATDRTPPSAPSNLTATVKSTSSVLLAWHAATDNGAVTRYDVYVNGTKLYSTTSLQFTVGALDASKFYSFFVRAVDSADNVSPPSNQVSVNTNGNAPDYTPGVPSGLTANAVNYTEIALTWTDTLSHESGFEIVRATSADGPYLPVGTVGPNKTTFADSGLLGGQTYWYKIRAISDASGSAYSSGVSATTAAAPSTPFAPTDLAATVAPNGFVALSWIDNSANEKGFTLYRSTDNKSFTELAALPANANAFSDTTATGTSAYFYYVVATNDAGSSPSSDTATIQAGNNAPVINGLSNVFVRRGGSVTVPFTVADDPGDHVTVSIPHCPSFVSAAHPSEGNYSLTITPGPDDAGVQPLTVIATDNHGKATSTTINITIGDNAARSIYVNFGSEGKTAAAPWNNWLGQRAAGDVLNNLRDETNATTGISITTVSAWDSTTNLGFITGNNSGVFPDDVLQSGLSDSSDSKQIKISGLDKSKQYNIALAGSQNEGITAASVYTSNDENDTLNARYNAHQTASLNNLVPDANGEIVVSISRAAGVPKTYLNGLVIEEYAKSQTMLAPGHLYAEALNKTTVNLTWNDRTNNENGGDGYELERSVDSSFQSGVTSVSLPANTTAYTSTGLQPNTSYWFRVRTKGGSDNSGYSNRVHVITPEMLVYVNFNTTVAPAAAPWNNLTAPPLSTFTSDPLNNESNVRTDITMTLTKEFNGEFTAGVNTGHDWGVVPDNALEANYWLDKLQQSQFLVNNLNHARRYTFGFWGSSSTPDWFKGNYTATYNVGAQTVYLNSWFNSTKVVYIHDVAPDENGKVALNFSTTPEAGYGFNGGVIMHVYTDSSAFASIPTDTIPLIVDTTGNGGGGGGGGQNPPPVDTPKTGALKVYPNPTIHQFTVSFTNARSTNDITLEIYDPKGVLAFRKRYGHLPVGSNAFQLNDQETHIKSGLYIVALKVGGKVDQTVKLIKIRY